MPSRNLQFDIGGVYHIFNRGVDKRKIFLKNQDYSRFILGLYIFNDTNPKYDIWTSLKFNKTPTLGSPGDPSVGGDSYVDSRDRCVELLAFALMPNHYHILVTPLVENGISKFMQKMSGYARYFNLQNERKGTLFESRYKAVEVKNETQLVTIFNYIHTNPVELIEPRWKDLELKDKNLALQYLGNYKWSSYNDYIGKKLFSKIINQKLYFNLLGGVSGCKQSVEDWITFKHENYNPTLS